MIIAKEVEFAQDFVVLSSAIMVLKMHVSPCSKGLGVPHQVIAFVKPKGRMASYKISTFKDI